MSKAKDFYVRCNNCEAIYKNSVGSTPCCGSIAYVIEDVGNIKAYYDRCIKQVKIELKEKQKEYWHGSSAYNVLRSLETTIPSALKEELTK